MTNGFTYYYCVAAYDWNYQTTQWDSLAHRSRSPGTRLILRSGLVANFSTVPRWEAVNYVMPTTNVVTAVGDTTKPGMRWLAEVVVPSQVTADTYELRFLGPGVRRRRDQVNLPLRRHRPRNDSVVIDTTSFSYTIGNTLTRALPVFNGLALNCSLHLATPTRPFDSAYAVRRGSVPGRVGGRQSRHRTEHELGIPRLRLR